MTEIDDRPGLPPGAEAILEAELLTHLTASGERGETPAALWRAFEHMRIGAAGAAPGRQALERALDRLQNEGEIVELDERWIALSQTDLAIGELEVLDGDDARLRPPGPRAEATHFVPRRHRNGAVAGDRVLVEPMSSSKATKGSRGDRSTARLPRAAVVKVLGGPRRLVGRVETLHRSRSGGAGSDGDKAGGGKAGSGKAKLSPFDARLPLEVIVEPAGDLRRHEYVMVELLPQRRTDRLPRGRLLESLGMIDDPGTDARVMLRHHEIPESFPAAVSAAAEALPTVPSQQEMAGRLDLRGETIFTIDGESARDFDDAVSWQRLSGGRHRVGVHIASVASYVPEGGVLDREAYRRGTSVYFPEGAVPMLPERLSNGLCSLRPNEPRLTMSVFLELDDAGKVLGSEFAESVIESVRRLTYEEARRLLEEPRDDDRRQYGEVVPALTAMEKISRALTAARRRRGSLEFDLPLADLVLDDQGRLEGVRTGHRNVAHRIIEEMMIAANEAVARELSSHQAGGLYRVHEPPRLEALEELADSLRLFGLDLDVDLASRDPSALRTLLVAEEGKPEEALVAGLVLRALQRAIYHPHNDGHYALASQSYLHFTSPIRRYPDLVNHRALTRLLREGGAERSAGARRAPRDRPARRDERARQKEADKDEILRLARMAEQSSFTERRAERAERDLKQWKLTRFLAPRVGEEFSGRITGVKEFGLFVLLDEVPVDGLLHVASMGGDFYEYEADRHRLVGRSGGSAFRLGDPIRVRLVAVDERRRGLELALAGAAEPSGGRTGRSKSPAGGRSDQQPRARRGNRGEAAGDKGRRRSGRRR